MRPFYKPRGDGKVPFNAYNVQLGPSALARKGTSAEVADNHFPPAIARLARTVEAQLAFTDADEIARREAEDAVAEAKRKLDWTRSVCAFMATEIEMEIDGLRDEGAETAGEIAVHRTGLRKTQSPRTMKDLKQAIAEAEAKNAGLVERIAEAEARLAEVRAVLADQPGRSWRPRKPTRRRRRLSPFCRRPARRRSRGWRYSPRSPKGRSRRTAYRPAKDWSS